MGAGAGSAWSCRPTPGLIVYRYGADLFYANADRFADEVRDTRREGARAGPVVDRGRRAIGDIDLSAAQTVRGLAGRTLPQGVRVVFGRVNRYLLADMRRHRIAAIIGEGRIFPTLHEAIDAVRAEGGLSADPGAATGPRGH